MASSTPATRYPVYVPTKGRAKSALTIKTMRKYRTPFVIVVEEPEVELYRKWVDDIDYGELLVLPWVGNDATRKAFCEEREIENGGLIAVRNWIKERSLARGEKRHWQLDDNIRMFRMWYKKNRIPCEPSLALRACEEFVDRYENVAIAGLNYEMFCVPGINVPPFYLNVHVYSCSLILNEIPHRWRLAYNDDTDICLQVLSDGWCTVLLNAFMATKAKTMSLKGGNTDDLYQGDGRAKMSRALERMWPGIVTTERRYGRPAHCVKNQWRQFDTPLKRREDIDWKAIENGRGKFSTKVTVRQVAEVKSDVMRKILEDATPTTDP